MSGAHRGRIVVVEAGESPWLGRPVGYDGRGRDPEAVAEQVEIPDGDPRPAARYFHPGSTEDLQLFEARIAPDALVEQHAHFEDEIVYVLSGELVLGSRRLGPGCSVYVGGETLYSFRAGPDGLHFLNFRARADRSFIDKDAFMKLRERRRSEGSAGEPSQ